MTIYRNGIATLMATSVTLTALNTSVQSVSTANPFNVVAGDTVALLLSQTEGTPIVQVVTSTVCQWWRLFRLSASKLWPPRTDHRQP